jgi:hypothetical protein
MKSPNQSSSDETGLYPQPFRAEDLPCIIYRSCDTLAYPQRVSEKIAADIPRSIYRLVLLEFTGMTGMPHRPSSSDGQSPVFPPHLFRYRSRSSSFNPSGLTQEIARRSRSPYRVRLAARTVRRQED